MPRSLDAHACEKATRETRRTLELLGYAGDDDVQETEREGVQHSRELPLRSAAVEGASEHCRQVSRREGADRDEACSFAEFVEGDLPGVGASEGSEAEEGTGTPAGFQDSLREWAIEYGIKKRPLTALLKLLRRRTGTGSDLPKDGRTLLQTPRRPHERFPIRTVEPGKYSHFGLAAGLQHALCHVEKLPTVLPLTFNIDGLPLSKSSKMQLWPIQCLVGGMDDVAPFLVGAFAGHSKPASSNDFLVTFVEELQALLSQGVTVNGSLVQVKVRSIICDAPARAFITTTKGHGGYSGCPKCTVEGLYLDGRVAFLDMNCPLRTDLSFRQQHDAEHHKGESILFNLPINSAHDLPLDYMHLVLLGVVKKLLSLWTSGQLAVRLGPLERHAFNEKSEQLRPHIPHEFPRKSRGLDEMDRWKAVEFRLLLFYTGPLLLKLCLTDRLYQHFCSSMLLSQYLPTDSFVTSMPGMLVNSCGVSFPNLLSCTEITMSPQRTLPYTPRL
ncbi:unnamed protein product [Ixodes hexagonus]